MKIRNIWKVFKPLKIEKQFAFYIKDGQWYAQKISKEESIEKGTLDLAGFIQFCMEEKPKEMRIVHNHIDVDAKPSFEDRFQHQMLSSLCRLCGITLADYLIVSEYGYVSFLEEGWMEPRQSENIPVFPFSYEKRLLVENYTDFSKDFFQEERKNEYIITDFGIFSSPRFSVADIYQILASKSSHCFFIGDEKTTNLGRFQDLSCCFRFTDLYRLKDNHLISLRKNGEL